MENRCGQGMGVVKKGAAFRGVVSVLAVGKGAKRQQVSPLISAVMSCVSSGFSCISGAISKGHIQVRRLFEACSHHVSFSFLQVILGPMFSGKT